MSTDGSCLQPSIQAMMGDCGSASPYCSPSRPRSSPPTGPLKGAFRRVAKPHDSQSYFGTDYIGRDTLSRVICGARSSLDEVFTAIWLGTIVGSLQGLRSSCLGGKFDMRWSRV